MYHVKVVIVDEVWTSVGSTNFDNRSFRLNDEANLNVLDAEFAAGQVRVFEEDKVRVAAGHAGGVAPAAVGRARNRAARGAVPPSAVTFGAQPAALTAIAPSTSATRAFTSRLTRAAGGGLSRGKRIVPFEVWYPSSSAAWARSDAALIG